VISTDVNSLPTALADSPFLKACRREPVERIPIWLMRQAGRYMAEYRALRQQYGILDIIKTPELAVEVTLQPIKAFDLDAAIIFADILPLLEGMGLHLTFEKGEGPVIHNPLRTAVDIDTLGRPDPRESLSFTLNAVKLARQELPAHLPLIGFSGAPFTLASYAIEGGSSRNYVIAKSLMYDDPAAWQALMEKLAWSVGEYLYAQAEAGAQALQMFDSWIGALSPRDYEEFVLPYSRQAIARAKESGVPVIHFGTNTAGMLDLVKAAGSDVVGVDWRIDLDKAWAILGEETAVQGNFDPVTLFASPQMIQQRAAAILEMAAHRPGFIFNLGHGILPETPVEHVAALIDVVHTWKTGVSD
jgi:uroporphyrinogen decarboxylase